jgi:dihydrofolate reductase
VVGVRGSNGELAEDFRDVLFGQMAMSFAVVSGPSPHTRSTAREESAMAATYTFDVFSSLDGYGSYDAPGNWGGYWGKQGPELLDRRLALYDGKQRMVFGANTYREFVQMLGSGTDESGVGDPWVTRMRNLPATVVSSTLEGPLDWPDATVVSGDGVDVVARLKKESDVPLRSHGSLSLNWALMAAGLVDRVQVTLFPVIAGQTGDHPIFQGAADFDLELLESRMLDGHTQELIYRPTLHVWA